MISIKFIKLLLLNQYQFYNFDTFFNIGVDAIKIYAIIVTVIFIMMNYYRIAVVKKI